GVMMLESLGEVCLLPNYHTKTHIFPIGFQTSRTYSSMVNNDIQTRYTSTILKGDNGPVFQVVADDCPSSVVSANSASGAWQMVFKAINALRGNTGKTSVSGLDYFGLTHHVIKQLIQGLPNANLCENYDFTQPEKRVRKKKAKDAGTPAIGTNPTPIPEGLDE
ncbi:hypothetical protein HDV03_003187, partial [Kappamyces sp. JEL0829]